MQVAQIPNIEAVEEKMSRMIDLNNFLYLHSDQRGLDLQMFNIKYSGYKDLSYGFIPDCPRFAILSHKERNSSVPLAIISYDFFGDVGLLVKQIQGRYTFTSHQHQHLPQGWESLLVKSLSGWATTEGFKEIGIIKAENIEWFDRPHINNPARWKNANIGEHQARLKRRYDGLARKMKFKYDEGCDFYLHPLPLECGR